MTNPVEQVPPMPAPAPTAKTNVLTIISLVTGIIGFISMCLGIIPFLGWVCYGIGGLCAVAALVLGFVGMNQAKKNGEKGRGMAITGIVLGALGLLGICVFVVISLVMGPVIGNVFSQINSSLVAP